MSTPELSFATPATLIAALPHLLGFIPTNDIVALMLGTTDHPSEAPLRAAIRCPTTLNFADAQQLPAACRLTTAQFPTAVHVAVCEPHNSDHGLRALLNIRTALRRTGITVLRILTTHTVTQPDTWTDPDTGLTGPTTPYTDSPATTLGVVEGRIIAASRDDMEREFATTATAPPLDLEAQDLTTLVAHTAADLQRTIRANSLPTTQLAVRAAVIVTAHRGLRDAFLRLGVGHDLAAGRIWTHIAAPHRGRTRAELLTLAAQATRDDNSTLPQLATTVHTALQAGMPPSKIRSVIPSRDTHPIPGTDL